MNGVRSVSFRETPNGLEVHVYKSKTSSAGKLKKRLPYNFKQLSKQIMQAKTSDAARPLVAKMRAKLSWLYKQLRNGDYGESEVSAAIIHAAAMERIAKRKVRHLEEEEAAENGASGAGATDEDDEIYGKDELKKSLEENEEISDEMMRKMMEEIEKLEEELSDDTMSELNDMLSCASGDMSEEDLEQLKKKHRNDEEKQLTRADLRYLKALFDGLEQEKRQLVSSSVGSSGSSGGFSSEAFSCAVDGSADLEMMDMGAGDTLDISI